MKLRLVLVIVLLFAVANFVVPRLDLSCLNRSSASDAPALAAVSAVAPASPVLAAPGFQDSPPPTPSPLPEPADPGTPEALLLPADAPAPAAPALEK